MEPLVAALAGGAVGAALAALAGVPAQVRAHNRLLSEYDQELGNWIADESVRLERELKRTTRRYADSGEQGELGHARALAQVKEESLRAYRDSELAAEHQRAALRDGEGWQHELWRWLTVRGQLPPLRMPRKVRPIVDTWREPVSFGEITAQVNDPTRRDLDEILAELARKQASPEDENPGGAAEPHGENPRRSRAVPDGGSPHEQLPQGG
jgi:hypothetical protein